MANEGGGLRCLHINNKIIVSPVLQVSIKYLSLANNVVVLNVVYLLPLLVLVITKKPHIKTVIIDLKINVPTL